ncbi:hypothetical protein [Halobacterium zhouii]|uniref:hypothetical protein n=1 Tax=Halobacterium zhouii TaxID=2902624 RepID=UPI001E43C695|nr:hypothetical protein [Halobacterium zhouii]
MPSVQLSREQGFRYSGAGRNIVAFDSSAELVWTVSDSPLAVDSADPNYYLTLLTITGAIYARDVEKRLYEIDPSNGEIVRTLDNTTLPIAGKDVSIGGWVLNVVEFGEYVVVECAGSDAPSLYGFNKEGTELWRADERRGTVYWDGNVLIEKVERGPRVESHYFYRLDPDTGERLAEIEVEYTVPDYEYVADISEDV